MAKSFFRITAPVIVAAALLASCGGDAKPSASPTLRPTSAPSLTDAPTGLALADRLYYEGDFEQAIAIYAATAARGKDNERNQALRTLARVQYQRGQHAEAERTAEAFLDRQISPAEERQATLLLGMLEFAQGDAAEAEGALTSYMKLGGPAIPYAQLRLADLAALRDDHAQAIELAQSAIAASLPPQIEDAAQFAIARYQTDSGDTPGALATYAALANQAEFRIDRAEAFWLAGELAYRSGDQAAAADSLRLLVIRYPAQPRTLEALSHPALEAALSNADRAPVLFQQRINEQATQAYAALIADADPSNAADAHYHLGILAERAENYDDAVAQYDAAIALLPPAVNDALLGQSLWDRATVHERFGRIDEAVQGYSSIADVAPTSEHVHEGLFRGGFLRYQQRLFPDASAIWQRLLESRPDAETQARTHFWLANAASEPGLASQHRMAAFVAAPLDYYGMRSHALLGALSPPSSNPPPDAPTPDWNAIERWLQPDFSSPTTTPTATPVELPAMPRALELLHAGLEGEADAEFEALLEEATQAGPETLYRFTRTLVDEGRTSLAARAGARLAATSTDPPSYVLQLAYPLPYYDLVTNEAEVNGISPLLLLALVRQESLYNPSAASPAAATGLTQVIPGTGADIAAALGDSDFTNGDLLRPNVSLRYGAYYLGQQLEYFNGNLSAALAAYNGGPGNAERWLESASNDTDLFLETIDFSETRSYLELVMEHYAAYLYAYGLTSEPSLALP